MVDIRLINDANYFHNLEKVLIVKEKMKGGISLQMINLFPLPIKHNGLFNEPSASETDLHAVAFCFIGTPDRCRASARFNYFTCIITHNRCQEKK